MTGFFKAATRPEREPSRPRYINPKTGEVQSWQRASNFAAPLESPFGMIKHKTRQVVRGLNRRLDLARMLLTGAVIEDKVDEVIETALSAAEEEAKANNGTAVHAALGLCDTGREVPQEYLPHAQAYVAELKRHNLRPVAVEQRILNTRLGATGTFDRLYVTDSGRYLVGDIKTGNLNHPHGYAVQCEVYSGADYLIHENGAASTVEPIPWPIDQSAALIIHVDPETGATSIYEVSLHVARWGAALAEQVRAFQRTDVLLPYSGAPTGPLADELRREAVQAVARAADVPAAFVVPPAGVPNAEQVRDSIAATIERAVQTRTDAAARQLGMDEEDAAAVAQHVQQAGAPSAPAAAPAAPSASRTDDVVAGVSLDQHSAAISGPLKSVIALGSDEYQARLAELMKPKNNKAVLQGMLHALGGRDLAHNRKWLAEKIIEMENGIAAAQQQQNGNGTTAAKNIAQTAEIGVPAAEATPFTLKQIAEAASIEDLQRIHQNIIQRSGEAAWTPAMQEVAAARHAELDAPMPDGSPLTRIADAKSLQDLAQVWESVTSSGANVAAWAPAYDKAARDRAAAIQSAQPQNTNPWGSQ